MRLAIPILTATAALAYAIAPVSKRVKPGMVAVITGGSRGLGLALAHRFGRAGCKLVLASRKEDELELARDGILRSRDVTNEDDILLVAADLSDPDQCTGLIENAIRTFGRIDILINNAGIIEVGPAENQATATYEKTMQINFFAALYCIQAAMPAMLKQGAGAIVNIASVGGKIPVPHLLPYVAAKFALTGFSEGLHAELRGKNVRVTTVCPGLLRSGGEAHADFVGNVEAEKKWFNEGAKSKIVAVDVNSAANRIFAATNRGQAELVISPQAWLGARAFGLAPNLSLFVASLVNDNILPAPTADVPGNTHHHEHPQPTAEETADPSPS